MKKINLIIATLCVAGLAVAACSEKETTEEVLPVFEGVIETSESVDLGLSVKWGGMNIGAESPEQAGDYFACGQNKPIEDTLNRQNFIYDGSVDPVTSIKGGTWRLPSIAEITELAECEIAKVKYNGKKGFAVTGKNGNVVFFPVCGYKTGGKFKGDESAFWYQGGTAEGGDLFIFQANSDTTYTASKSSTLYPYLGFPLRGVCD